MKRETREFITFAIRMTVSVIVIIVSAVLLGVALSLR